MDMTIKQIITALITNNDLDGETMQYIIESIGMRDQMLRQLVLTASPSELNDLMDEYQEVSKYNNR
ncbi:hypothetical protein UFOVP331_136 [uncultured Caudovirales phage]|uniref:Uncharacterized protein n=1 Tax=uncultured Caudovirales phage TaxID=2100421 RepID=A0A6J5M0E4_9CAUD|nr:hypothetical protein UFOVP331_136 [uncultured Caudovirales phage]